MNIYYISNRMEPSLIINFQLGNSQIIIVPIIELEEEALLSYLLVKTVTNEKKTSNVTQKGANENHFCRALRQGITSIDLKKNVFPRHYKFLNYHPVCGCCYMFFVLRYSDLSDLRNVQKHDTMHSITRKMLAIKISPSTLNDHPCVIRYIGGNSMFSS